MSYSLSYNYNKSPGMSKSDEIYALNLSLPLSLWLRPQNDVSQKHNYAYATYNISTDKKGETSQNAGINGTLLEDNNLSYSVQEGYSSQAQNHKAPAALNTIAPMAMRTWAITTAETATTSR